MASEGVFDGIDSRPLFRADWGEEASVSHLNSSEVLGIYLKACNRGVDIIGGAPAGTYDSYSKTTDVDMATVHISLPTPGATTYKFEHEWTPEELDGEDLWEFNTVELRSVDSAPHNRGIVGGTTTLKKLDMLDDDWTSGASAKAVKAATRLAALEKRAGEDPTETLAVISKAWGMDSKLVTNRMSSPAVDVSIGRIVASTGVVSQVVHGIENFGGDFSILPVGVNAKTFMDNAIKNLRKLCPTYEFDSLRAEVAFDFGRTATWARVWVAEMISHGDPVLLDKGRPDIIAYVKMNSHLATVYLPDMFMLKLDSKKYESPVAEGPSEFKKLFDYFNSEAYLRKALSVLEEQLDEEQVKYLAATTDGEGLTQDSELLPYLDAAPDILLTNLKKALLETKRDLARIARAAAEATEIPTVRDLSTVRMGSAADDLSSRAFHASPGKRDAARDAAYRDGSAPGFLTAAGSLVPDEKVVAEKPLAAASLKAMVKTVGTKIHEKRAELEASNKATPGAAPLGLRLPSPDHDLATCQQVATWLVPTVGKDYIEKVLFASRTSMSEAIDAVRGEIDFKGALSNHAVIAAAWKRGYKTVWARCKDINKKDFRKTAESLPGEDKSTSIGDIDLKKAIAIIQRWASHYMGMETAYRTIPGMTVQYVRSQLLASAYMNASLNIATRSISVANFGEWMIRIGKRYARRENKNVRWEFCPDKVEHICQFLDAELAPEYGFVQAYLDIDKAFKHTEADIFERGDYTTIPPTFFQDKVFDHAKPHILEAKKAAAAAEEKKAEVTFNAFEEAMEQNMGSGDQDLSFLGALDLAISHVEEEEKALPPKEIFRRFVVGAQLPDRMLCELAFGESKGRFTKWADCFEVGIILSPDMITVSGDMVSIRKKYEHVPPLEDSEESREEDNADIQ